MLSNSLWLNFSFGGRVKSLKTNMQLDYSSIQANFPSSFACLFWLKTTSNKPFIKCSIVRKHDRLEDFKKLFFITSTSS